MKPVKMARSGRPALSSSPSLVSFLRRYYPPTSAMSVARSPGAGNGASAPPAKVVVTMRLEVEDGAGR